MDLATNRPRLTSPERIAVVIPAYRTGRRVVDVVRSVGREVSAIYVVDDACPEGVGEMLEGITRDPRLVVIRRRINGGVGAATLDGFIRAASDGATIIAKIDGDGQMDPAFLSVLIEPLLQGRADYVKANRFMRRSDYRSMPSRRLVGNICTSMISKLSSGYWHISDTTNGYVAIRASVFRTLEWDDIDRGFFFESDMLFHLCCERAVVADVPMKAIYNENPSNLKFFKNLPSFFWGHFRNMARRLSRQYVVQDFSIGSVLLLGGLGSSIFGLLFGLRAWSLSNLTGQTASAGTVMLAALPFMLGVQALFTFMIVDMLRAPTKPIHPALEVEQSKQIETESRERRSRVV